MLGGCPATVTTGVTSVQGLGPAPARGDSGTHRRLLGALLVGRHSSHLGDDGSHVGGAVELDFGQAALVGLHDALDACGVCEG